MKLDPTGTISSQQEVKPTIETGFMNALKNFGRGALTGIGLVFIAIILTQFYVLGSYWFDGFVFFTIIAIIGALVLGLPTSGLGGLILGSIWKSPKAAIVGGAIAALLLSPIIFELFSSCALLGGC
jgi:hypothetical protein